MHESERVLIVFVKSRQDWEIARLQGWYRLPLRHGPRDIAARWIAFYQPGAFGAERWGVYSYARIRETHVVRRIDLFPHEPNHPRAQQHYHVISFESPLRLARPLLSDHGRRFVWTDTTWWRFTSAQSLDDLFNPEPLPVAVRDQVLVGIVPRTSDFEILTGERWYRIPRHLVEHWVTPEHLAFYFGAAFGGAAGTIRYYARVVHADVVKRLELFPTRPRHPRANMSYVRVHVEQPRQRAEPITSRRSRRLVLLPTTWARFVAARDINDLYEGDAEEEALYLRMNQEGLKPERAYYVRGPNAYYLTDFAFHGRKGNLHVDIEHPSEPDPSRLRLARPEGAARPARGWSALRLSRFDITKRQDDALRRIRELVKTGGLTGTG